MREIKFRVWTMFEGELTAFYPEPKHDFNECRLTFGPSGKPELVVEVIYHETGSGVAEEFSRYVEHDIVALDQWTGLKDKNGVEIYEGDIIDLGDKNSLSHWPKIVEVSWSPDGYWLYWACFADCVVIGNIHQNPELLS